jgi:hypothetical protein
MVSKLTMAAWRREIKEVLSDAEVAGAAALLAGEMGERVLDLHAFA